MRQAYFTAPKAFCAFTVAFGIKSRNQHARNVRSSSTSSSHAALASLLRSLFLVFLCPFLSGLLILFQFLLWFLLLLRFLLLVLRFSLLRFRILALLDLLRSFLIPPALLLLPLHPPPRTHPLRQRCSSVPVRARFYLTRPSCICHRFAPFLLVFRLNFCRFCFFTPFPLLIRMYAQI